MGNHIRQLPPIPVIASPSDRGVGTLENTQMKDTKDMKQFESRLSLKVCPCCCEYFAGAGFSGLPLYNTDQRVCRRCYTNTVAPARMDFEQRRVK